MSPYCLDFWGDCLYTLCVLFSPLLGFSNASPFITYQQKNSIILNTVFVLNMETGKEVLIVNVDDIIVIGDD